MRLTKIDAAESHIAGAVRLYFKGQPIAPVLTLAAAARETLTNIGEKTGTRTILHGLAEATGIPIRELVKDAHQSVNFFKHADRDATGSIEIDDEHVAMVLLVACGDFGRITGGMPIEAQVYEAWWFATATKKVAELPRKAKTTIRNVIRHFPTGMRTSSLEEQKQMGWDMLVRYEHDDALKMDIKRVVEIVSTASV